eukprot:9485607-Lingulodinium_polyedra.AAC.1
MLRVGLHGEMFEQATRAIWAVRKLEYEASLPGFGGFFGSSARSPSPTTTRLRRAGGPPAVYSG